MHPVVGPHLYALPVEGSIHDAHSAVAEATTDHETLSTLEI